MLRGLGRNGLGSGTAFSLRTIGNPLSGEGARGLPGIVRAEDRVNEELLALTARPEATLATRSTLGSPARRFCVAGHLGGGIRMPRSDAFVARCLSPARAGPLRTASHSHFAEATEQDARLQRVMFVRDSFPLSTAGPTLR